MSIEELASKILDALQSKGALLLLDEDAAREVVMKTLTGVPGPKRKDLPNRAPDFVFWIDHGKDGTTEVNCLPGAVVTVPDWVGLAEWTLHHGSRALSQSESIHYTFALRGIVEGALEFARLERDHGKT